MTDTSSLKSSAFDIACNWLAKGFRKQLSRGSTISPEPEKVAPPLSLASLERKRLYHEGESGRYSARYRSAFVINFVLGLVAVAIALVPLAGVLGEHALHEFGPALTMAEMMCIVAILLFHIAGREQHHPSKLSKLLQKLGFKPNQAWRRKWVEHRLYGEQLRYGVLFIGFPGEVIPPEHDASHLLDMGLESALRSWFESHGQACLTQPLDQASLKRYQDYLEFVIEEQRVYHGNNAARCNKIHHRLHGWANLAFWLTLAGCALHLFWHAPLLSALAAFFPAMAATCHGIINAGEYAKLADVSNKMQAALALLQKQLAKAGAAGAPAQQAAALRAVLLQLYELTISEARGWHLALRDKDIQVG